MFPESLNNSIPASSVLNEFAFMKGASDKPQISANAMFFSFKESKSTEPPQKQYEIQAKTDWNDKPN